jgi:hypothetical protein
MPIPEKTAARNAMNVATAHDYVAYQGPDDLSLQKEWTDESFAGPETQSDLQECSAI